MYKDDEDQMVWITEEESLDMEVQSGVGYSSMNDINYGDHGYFDGQIYLMPVRCTCGRAVSRFQIPMEDEVKKVFQRLKSQKQRGLTSLSWCDIKRETEASRSSYIRKLKEERQVRNACCVSLLMGFPIPLDVPNTIESSDEEEEDVDPWLKASIDDLTFEETLICE